MQAENNKRKKKLLVICPHPVGYVPGQRLKYEQYFEAFRQNGYEVTVSPFMSEAFQKIVYKKGKWLTKILWTVAGYVKRIGDLFRMGNYDVVYVFLWVAPFAPPVFEKLTRRLSKKMVYDIDDLVFLNPRSSFNPVANYLRSSRNHITLMKSADHVITCTPYLDQFVRKYNPVTTDISSTINTTAYRRKRDYSVQGRFVIGWSGSHSTIKYLHLLDDVLREVAREHDFKLVVMGDTSFQLEGVDTELLPWKEEYEVEVISRFDIGLYPLPDEKWIYGKSGLKALQYMALGVPTVATKIGTILRIIQDGENGFLVESKEEWKRRIIDLITDKQLCEKIGKNAAATVNEQYSVNANKGTYLSILNSLTS